MTVQQVYPRILKKLSRGCHDIVPSTTLDLGERRDAIKIDLGDVSLNVFVRVKGLRRHKIVWHLGPVRGTTPTDRIIKPPPYHRHTGRVDLIMDLRADQQVPLSIAFTDEVGNPVLAPSGVAVAYTVDDPTIINLTDAGDGTAVAAATGTLGTANVHADVTWDGETLSGDLQIVVVAGLAERVAIVAGEPTEVTPDA